MVNRVRHMRPSGDINLRRELDAVMTDNAALGQKVNRLETELQLAQVELRRREDRLKFYESLGNNQAMVDHPNTVKMEVTVGRLPGPVMAQVHMLLRILMERALVEVSVLTQWATKGRIWVEDVRDLDSEIYSPNPSRTIMAQSFRKNP